MPENQKKIYYATGKDRAAIDSLPQMELLRDKGIEVLYFLDNVDELQLKLCANMMVNHSIPSAVVI